MRRPSKFVVSSIFPTLYLLTFKDKSTRTIKAKHFHAYVHTALGTTVSTGPNGRMAQLQQYVQSLDNEANGKTVKSKKIVDWSMEDE